MLETDVLVPNNNNNNNNKSLLISTVPIHQLNSSIDGLLIDSGLNTSINTIATDSGIGTNSVTPAGAGGINGYSNTNNCSSPTSAAFQYQSPLQFNSENNIITTRTNTINNNTIETNQSILNTPLLAPAPSSPAVIDIDTARVTAADSNAVAAAAAAAAAGVPIDHSLPITPLTSYQLSPINQLSIIQPNSEISNNTTIAINSIRNIRRQHQSSISNPSLITTANNSNNDYIPDTIYEEYTGQYSILSLKFHQTELEQLFIDYSAQKNDYQTWKLLILATLLYTIPIIIAQLIQFNSIIPIIIRSICFTIISILTIGYYIKHKLIIQSRPNNNINSSIGSITVKSYITQLILFFICLVFLLSEHLDSFTSGDNSDVIDISVLILMYSILPVTHIRFTYQLILITISTIIRILFTILLATNTNTINSIITIHYIYDNTITIIGRESIIILSSIGILLLSWQTEHRERREFWNRNLLAETVENNQILLHRMLPLHVIGQLQSGKSVIAEYYDNITILFADLTGFKQLVYTVSPVYLVQILDRLFNRFDELTEIYNVYKVETVFDTYMAVKGLPEKCSSELQVTSIALLALAMIDIGKQLEIEINNELMNAYQNRNYSFNNTVQLDQTNNISQFNSNTAAANSQSSTPEQNHQYQYNSIFSKQARQLHNKQPPIIGQLLVPLAVRIGIHTGSLMAGVIGNKLPRYRLFGDSVNTAARMCHHSTGGRIHCSPDTVQLLQDSTIQPKINVCDTAIRTIKGKGEISTSFIVPVDLSQTPKLQSPNIIPTTNNAITSKHHRLASIELGRTLISSANQINSINSSPAINNHLSRGSVSLDIETARALRLNTINQINNNSILPVIPLLSLNTPPAVRTGRDYSANAGSPSAIRTLTYRAAIGSGAGSGTGSGAGIGSIEPTFSELLKRTERLAAHDPSGKSQRLIPEYNISGTSRNRHHRRKPTINGSILPGSNIVKSIIGTSARRPKPIITNQPPNSVAVQINSPADRTGRIRAHPRPRVVPVTEKKTRRDTHSRRQSMPVNIVTIKTLTENNTDSNQSTTTIQQLTRTTDAIPQLIINESEPINPIPALSTPINLTPSAETIINQFDNRRLSIPAIELSTNPDSTTTNSMDFNRTLPSPLNLVTPRSEFSITKELTSDIGNGLNDLTVNSDINTVPAPPLPVQAPVPAILTPINPFGRKYHRSKRSMINRPSIGSIAELNQTNSAAAAAAALPAQSNMQHTFSATATVNSTVIVENDNEIDGTAALGLGSDRVTKPIAHYKKHRFNHSLTVNSISALTGKRVSATEVPIMDTNSNNPPTSVTTPKVSKHISKHSSGSISRPTIVNNNNNTNSATVVPINNINNPSNNHRRAPTAMSMNMQSILELSPTTPTVNKRGRHHNRQSMDSAIIGGLVNNSTFHSKSKSAAVPSRIGRSVVGISKSGRARSKRELQRLRSSRLNLIHRSYNITELQRDHNRDQHQSELELPFQHLNPDTVKLSIGLKFIEWSKLEQQFQNREQRKIFANIQIRLLATIIIFTIITIIQCLIRLYLEYSTNTVAINRLLVGLLLGSFPCSILLYAMTNSRTYQLGCIKSPFIRLSRHLHGTVIIILGLLSTTLLIADIQLIEPSLSTFIQLCILNSLSSIVFRVPFLLNISLILWSIINYLIIFLIYPTATNQIVNRDIIIKYSLFLLCLLILIGSKSRLLEIRARNRFLTLLGIKKQRKDTSALLQRLLPKSCINQLLALQTISTNNNNNNTANNTVNTNPAGNTTTSLPKISQFQLPGSVNQDSPATTNIPFNISRRISAITNLPPTNENQLITTINANRTELDLIQPIRAELIDYSEAKMKSYKSAPVQDNRNPIQSDSNNEFDSNPVSTAVTPIVTRSIPPPLSTTVSSINLYSPPKLIAHYHPAVTVMQADICGFTPICARSSPEQIISMLNSLFILFDALTDQFKVYKVETIGDAYLCCSGAPLTNPNHAHSIADLSLAARDSLKHYTTPHDQQPIRMRFGIDSGPVVGGVVGMIKMPRYHIFGQTVRIAAQMESNAEPMSINISENTQLLIQSEFNTISTGMIPIEDSEQELFINRFELISRKPEQFIEDQQDEDYCDIDQQEYSDNEDQQQAHQNQQQQQYDPVSVSIGNENSILAQSPNPKRSRKLNIQPNN